MMVFVFFFSRLNGQIFWSTRWFEMVICRLLLITLPLLLLPPLQLSGAPPVAPVPAAAGFSARSRAAAAVATPAAAFAATTQRQAVVFESSTGPYPCIRIPSALALPGGEVLAFAECRRWAGDQCFVAGQPNASRSGEFNRSICMRRSTDGGRSWGPLQPNITRRYSASEPRAVWNGHLLAVQ